MVRLINIGKRDKRGNMWLEKILLLCIFILALLGTAFLGIILHEYSHYNDFKDFNVTDNEICGLVLPMKWENVSSFLKQPAGFYSYRIYINKSNDTSNIIYKKYQEIDKHTETKAYTISALVFIFFIFCYWVITFSMFRDKEKILNQQIDGLEKDIYIHQLENHILLHANKYNQDEYDANNTT